MNLTLFFRLIVMSIFQSQQVFKVGTANSKYRTDLFYAPVVYANDGWNVSLQIHSGNYCSSENGYRTLGHTFEEVEFGFPSANEYLLHEHTEGWGYESWDEEGSEIPFDSSSFTSVGKVGRIPVDVMEEIFKQHGGINWEKTISISAFRKLVKL